MNLNKKPLGAKTTFTEPRKNVYGKWEVSEYVEGYAFPWNTFSFKTRKSALEYIESRK